MAKQNPKSSPGNLKSTNPRQKAVVTNLFHPPDIFFGFLLFFLFLAWLLSFFPTFFSRRTELEFDFTHPAVAAEWEFDGAANYEVTPQGLKIQALENFMLLSPSPDKTTYLGLAVAWEDLPFIKMEFSESPQEQEGLLVWRPPGSESKTYQELAHRSFDIRQSAKYALIHTQNFNPARRHLGWTGPIGQCGFQLKGNMTLRRIVLVSALSPSERLKFFFQEWFSPERFMTYSINFLYGPYTAQSPFIFYCALCLVLLAFFTLLHTCKWTLFIFFAGALGLFVFLDMPFHFTMFEHLKMSRELSAFKSNLDEERKSRFGQEFAELAKAFEETVPRGSKVLFTEERLFRVKGETNWIYFHFHPFYHSFDPVKSQLNFSYLEPSAADYIFYFYPWEYNYDENSGMLQYGPNFENGIPVELLFKVSSEALLFKVRHA